MKTTLEKQGTSKVNCNRHISLWFFGKLAYEPIEDADLLAVRLSLPGYLLVTFWELLGADFDSINE